MSEELLAPRWGYASITDKISDIVLHRPVHWVWALGFGIAGTLTLVLMGCIAWLFAVGIGIWGVDIPVAWGFAIINFVWWIGIGHAGTFISAILLLLRQKWRTSINRFAEAMTLFAAGIAGLFPILHLGRPWFFYWLVPYPDVMNVWPQWRSPLVWDIFAISTYLTVSLLFWYVGLIPDLATLRDRAHSRVKRVVYGLFALGWRGEARHWARFEIAYLLLAGLAAPLVISVHSVVSLDFAVGNTPGYHSTIFPPYFVAGRALLRLRDGAGARDPDAQVLRARVVHHAAPPRQRREDHARHRAHRRLRLRDRGVHGLLQPGPLRDRDRRVNRMAGPYAPVYWTLLFLNVVVPQVLWWRSARRSIPVLFTLGILINVGMWMERFMIVVTSLNRDFLPSSWGLFIPTAVDWTMLAGSIGLFACLFLLFVRVLPAISIFEMRELVGRGAANERLRADGRVRERRGAARGGGRGARCAGYARIEAYAPFPVEGLAEAVGFAHSRVPLAVLLGGIAGGVGGYLPAVVLGGGASYPENIGGRPLHSWPEFIPATFETDGARSRPSRR